MTAVLCVGAHGSDIAVDILQEARLYDDDIGKGHQPLWAFQGGPAYVGVNDPKARETIARRWKATNPRGWVHRSALIDRSIWGEHTHINAGCIVIRAALGKFCTLAPRVTVCGDVTIGDRVFVGAGATICNLVSVGDDAVIGAGAVVPPRTHVPSGEVWFGVPARPR